MIGALRVVLAKLEGATGYLPGGVAYIEVFQSLETGTAYLHFDGVYNNAEIF